jgi:hypothetical protein
MTIDFNINALIAYLKENGLSPEFQKETGQIFIVYKIQEHEVPVFLLLRPESTLLQMVAYLPYRLPKKVLAEVARLLHILNKELDMPGFGLDEIEELMFYRAVFPCLHGKIDKSLFNMYLGTARIACDTFMHAIGMVVSGTVRVDEVMKEKNTKK